MEWIANPHAWVALVTLVVLELVLGIDNIIFISIIVSRLPQRQQAKGRIIGLGVAMVMRIILLVALSWVMGLTDPLLSVFGNEFSGRDMILALGGMFLIAKSTREIHNALEGETGNGDDKQKKVSLLSVLVQIALLDMVFSLDSVITAVGLAEELMVMIIAVILAVLVMMVASGPIARFVENHPTVKMLALSFLVLLGFTLLLDGFGIRVPKGYIYFGMAFSFAVEMLNLRMRRRKKSAAEPVKLRRRR